ncbi:MAG: PEP-CTERM sorting domain-containing protein [Acidobacteriota bacterium]
MIRRVTWIVGGFIAFAMAGRGITIPVTAYSTGFSSSGSLLTTDAAPDGNWTFYAGNSLSALNGSPVGAWVVRTNLIPFVIPGWSANSSSSQWITPTSARWNFFGWTGIYSVSSTSYVAVTSFQIPAMTDPPNLPQWWLVMSGEVWADQGVAGNAFYLLDSLNNPVYAGTLTGTPSYTASAGFQLSTWVDPGATYKLAFILPNAADTLAGFRLQLSEAYVTPEPGAWALMLSVGAGLALASWRRRKAKRSQP